MQCDVLSVLTKSSATCGSWGKLWPLSLPLKSRCSVAGKEAHCASTLCYVTGGNTHPRNLSLSHTQTHKYEHTNTTQQEGIFVESAQWRFHILCIPICPYVSTFSALCISLVEHLQPRVHCEWDGLACWEIRQPSENRICLWIMYSEPQYSCCPKPAPNTLTLQLSFLYTHLTQLPYPNISSLRQDFKRQCGKLVKGLMWAGLTTPSRLYCMSASDHHGDWQAEAGQPGQRKSKQLPDSSSGCHCGQDPGQAATTPLKTTAECDSSPSLLHHCPEIGKKMGSKCIKRKRRREFGRGGWKRNREG